MPTHIRPPSSRLKLRNPCLCAAFAGTSQSFGQALSQLAQIAQLLNPRYSLMVKIVQTWPLTAPQLYNIQNVIST